jgi:hypothetical protein
VRLLNRGISIALIGAALLSACFEPRKVSLGSIPSARTGASAGAGGSAGDMMDDDDDDESKNEEIDNSTDAMGSEDDDDAP